MSQPTRSRVRDALRQRAGLVAWYRPYLRGQERQFVITIVLACLVLAAQALTPLQVESILHHGEWNLGPVLVLSALVLAQIVFGHFVGTGAHDLSGEVRERLQSLLFQRMLRSRGLGKNSSARSGLVNRYTIDPDIMADAFNQTIHAGIPGVVRIVQSLVLLTVIEWRAGVAMTAAATSFILLQAVMSRRMRAVDLAAAAGIDQLGDQVNESLGASRLVSAMGLERWMTAGFERRVKEARRTNHHQGRVYTWFESGARTAGLAGLFAVVALAAWRGTIEIESVAASLLYVEGVVAGLESLPSWLRSLHIADTTRAGLDAILREQEAPDSLPVAVRALGPERLELEKLELKRGVTGLVTAPGVDPDLALTVLATGSRPDAWRETIDGFDVRMPGIGEGVVHVPHDTAGFDVSARDFLQALRDDAQAQEFGRLLSGVGLEHVFAADESLDRPLGIGGSSLTIDERQRLALAAAVAAQPSHLLVGPIVALADVDTALPLLATLRSLHPGATVVNALSSEVAEAVDRVLFVSRELVHVGSHTELLSRVPAYAETWQRRLMREAVDLSVLGLAEDDMHSMYARLVTERFPAGQAIYREGSPADRIVFVISGRVEITTTGADGRQHRVAVHGPGDHCGDLRLTVGERRAENAIALDDVVVRSLGREAIAAGMTGLLERTPSERRIVSTILRHGPQTALQLADLLPDVDATLLASSLALLVRDGAVREHDGVMHTVQHRSVKSGVGALLDRLDF